MDGPSGTDLLVIDELTKSYDGVQALRGANLVVKRGEIHALLGENGAGKSTLIKTLAGAVRPDSGTITFDGEAAEFGSRAESMALGISIIFQHANLVPQLTVAENVVLGNEQRRFGYLRDGRQRQAISEVLARLGMHIDLNRTAASLSAGERQLVEIARALLQQTKLLVLDEPTASLGTEEVEHLHRVLFELRDSGIGIIYVSHRLEEVLSISNRLTVLRDGRTVGTADAHGTSTADVIQLMIGRDASHVFRKASDARAEVVLRVRDLSTPSGLQDINFDLHAGEILGVYGLLGSGRTELARAVFGADPIDSGTVETPGATIGRKRNPYRAARAGIGLVPEERTTQAVFPLLSVTDNMASGQPWLYTTWGVVRHRQRSRLVEKMSRQVRLKASSAGQSISELSGGNQQKVVLGRWMLGGAKLLIFDDPTVGVDIGAKEEIYRLISELTADGTAVLLLSSELPEVLGLSDRIMVLCHGAVAATYSDKDLSEQELLRAAHGEAA
jgi:ribose transport system ATP-binding protein